MEWSKLYANLTSDVRVQAAEADAKAGFLLIDSICYVTLAESQGFIPDTQVPRFGGPNLAGRVKALVGNELWLKVDGGYLLNPDIWNEERNLSDSAEKKRKADRERMRAKRADAREAGTSVASASRDSRATGRATSSSDKSGDGVARLSRTE